MPVDIQVRRIYDDPAPQDGTRVLVDRVWPRGVRKDAARPDSWAKDVAPSGELRERGPSPRLRGGAAKPGTYVPTCDSGPLLTLRA